MMVCSANTRSDKPSQKLKLSLIRQGVPQDMTLVGKEIIVELKNDLSIKGILQSVDQHLNFKLNNTTALDPEKFPHMLSVKSCFIRGSVVRYVHLPAQGIDIDMLEDTTRKEARQQAQQQ